MRLLISAGEASGEMYGAQLIAALQRRDPALECFGVGGERMGAAGCDLVVDAKELSVVGITEIVPRVPRIYAEFRKLVREIDRRRPDAGIVIDSPAFNFKVARELHRRGIPAIYYVCPQLWAWRERRIRFMRYISKALVIFPFEERWYREHGVDADFVGHPLVDAAIPDVSRIEFAGRHNLNPSKDWIALLPGSRRKEVRLNLRPMVEGALTLQFPTMIQDALGTLKREDADAINKVEAVMALEESGFLESFRGLDADYEFILPVASTVDPEWVRNEIGSTPIPVRLVKDACAALLHSRAAVVASGTATVEAAMMGTPMVVVYRVSPLTWRLGRPLVKVEHFAMVNLIAGREVVPELIQSAFTPQNVAAKLREILADSPAREKMIKELAEVRSKLKAGGDRPAAERAADAVLQALARPGAVTTG